MRIAAVALFVGFTLVGTVHAQGIGPAPKGPAEQIAMAAIKDAGHPCGTVVFAPLALTTAASGQCAQTAKRIECSPLMDSSSR